MTSHTEMLAVVLGGLFVASFRSAGRQAFRKTPLNHHFEEMNWSESALTIRFWLVTAIACALGIAPAPWVRPAAGDVLNRRRWDTREQLWIAIVTWIERTRRRQTARGRLTQIEYEAIMTTPASQAAGPSPDRAADPSGGDEEPGRHVETKALESALADGLTPRQIVATRPICPECQLEIIAREAQCSPNGLGAVWP